MNIEHTSRCTLPYITQSLHQIDMGHLLCQEPLKMRGGAKSKYIWGKTIAPKCIGINHEKWYSQFVLEHFVGENGVNGTMRKLFTIYFNKKWLYDKNKQSEFNSARTHTIEGLFTYYTWHSTRMEKPQPGLRGGQMRGSNTRNWHF